MKIFRFVKQTFISAMMFFSYYLPSENSLNAIPLNALPQSCISMSNQKCKARAKIVNVNSNNPIFYPFSVKASKCSGNCNDINDPYAKICIPDVVKDLNIKVFNLMSRTNETRNIKWHKTCKCECRLDAIVCNNRRRCNNDKCRCECKELIDKGVCDKSCDIGEHLDYKNCTCKKRLADKLVDECTETADEEVEITDNIKNIYNSCIMYIVLFSTFFTINVGISASSYYYKYSNRNKRNASRCDYVYQTTIY